MQLGDPFGEAEEPAIDTVPVACPDMVGLCLVGVAGALGLCGREVAALLRSQAEQPSAKVTTIAEHLAILYRNLSFAASCRSELKILLRIKPRRGVRRASLLPAGGIRMSQTGRR